MYRFFVYFYCCYWNKLSTRLRNDHSFNGHWLIIFIYLVRFDQYNERREMCSWTLLFINVRFADKYLRRNLTWCKWIELHCPTNWISQFLRKRLWSGLCKLFWISCSLFFIALCSQNWMFISQIYYNQKDSFWG